MNKKIKRVIKPNRNRKMIAAVKLMTSSLIKEKFYNLKLSIDRHMRMVEEKESDELVTITDPQVEGIIFTSPTENEKEWIVSENPIDLEDMT